MFNSPDDEESNDDGMKVRVSTKVVTLTVMIKQVLLDVSVEAVAPVALGIPEVVAAESRHVECIQYGIEWGRVRSFCVIVYFRISPSIRACSVHDILVSKSGYVCE